MMETQTPYEIRAVSGKGFGVFATRQILPGSEVVSCVAKDLTHISSDIPFSIAQYLFVDPDHFDAETQERRYLMVCGEMVFLNHSDTANCDVSWVQGNGGLPYARLIAKTLISQDEELTICYTDVCDYQAHGYF